MKSGLLYAVLSSLFLSTGFILAKRLLAYTNAETLNTLWFGLSFVLTISFLLMRNRSKTVRLFRTNWKDGVVIGLVNAVAATLWFHSINISGPTLTAFLVRFSTIFIIILGVIFLKERLHLHDVVGLLIALAGAFIISLTGGNYLAKGAVIALLASFAIAVQVVVSKVYVKTIDPLTLVSMRALFTATFLAIYAAALSKLQPFPAGQLPLLLVAVVLNAVLGFVFFYKSLELLDVSKVAVIRTVDPFVVVVYALAYFGTIPHPRELIGGLLVITGVLVTMYGHGITTMLRTVKWLPWFG